MHLTCPIVTSLTRPACKLVSRDGEVRGRSAVERRLGTYRSFVHGYTSDAVTKCICMLTTAPISLVSGMCSQGYYLKASDLLFYLLQRDFVPFANVSR